MQSDLDKGRSVYSMTGYGEGKEELDGRAIKASIRTFNHDGTSIKIRGLNKDPATAHKAEDFIKESFPRGRIEVKIEMEETSGLAPDELDREAIRESFTSLSELATDLGLEGGPKLGDLIALDLLKTKPPYRGEWSTVKEALEVAVTMTLDAQRREGDAVRDDLLDYLGEIECRLAEAEEAVPEIVRQYKQDLRERVEKLMDEGGRLEERELEKEVSKFADKVDVNEEISRARTHVDSARDTLEQGGMWVKSSSSLLRNFSGR